MRPLNGIDAVWGEGSVNSSLRSTPPRKWGRKYWFSKKNKVEAENLFDVTKMNPVFDGGDPDSDNPEQPEGEGIQNLVFEETDMDQPVSGEAEDSEYSTDSSASSDNEEEREESGEEKEKDSEPECGESAASAEESEDEGDNDTVRLVKVASRIKQWENCVNGDDPSSGKERMQTTSDPVKNNSPTALVLENTVVEPEEQVAAVTGQVDQETTEVDAGTTGKVDASQGRPSLLAKKVFIRDDPPPTKDIPLNPRRKLSSLISNWESRAAKGGPSSRDRRDDSDFLV